MFDQVIEKKKKLIDIILYFKATHTSSVFIKAYVSLVNLIPLNNSLLDFFFFTNPPLAYIISL